MLAKIKCALLGHVRPSIDSPDYITGRATRNQCYRCAPIQPASQSLIADCAGMVARLQAINDGLRNVSSILASMTAPEPARPAAEDRRQGNDRRQGGDSQPAKTEAADAGVPGPALRIVPSAEPLARPGRSLHVQD